MKSREQALLIAKKVRNELEKLYHERLRNVYLFGSCARDKAKEDSDVDVAIVLDQVRSQFTEIDRTSQFGSDLSLEEETLVEFYFVPDSEFKSGSRAIYRAIQREGIPV